VGEGVGGSFDGKNQNLGEEKIKFPPKKKLRSVLRKGEKRRISLMHHPSRLVHW